MAVAAIHQAGGRQWREEAGHIGVFARGFERMERLIGGLELQPFVGFLNLPGQPRRAAVEAVCVTAKTELVFVGGQVGDRLQEFGFRKGHGPVEKASEDEVAKRKVTAKSFLAWSRSCPRAISAVPGRTARGLY